MSKQTRKASLAESLVNVAVGYCLSVAVTAVVLPWMFAIYIPLASNLEIGMIFTLISIARSFALTTTCLNNHHAPRTKLTTSNHHSFKRPSSSRLAISQITRPASISVEPVYQIFTPVAEM